jgi:hypothetical protein
MAEMTARFPAPASVPTERSSHCSPCPLTTMCSRCPRKAFLFALLLVSVIALLGAPAAGDTQAPSPWQGTGIDLGFLEETLEDRRCARSDRSFLSCVGAVQRVLDVHGQHLQLVPASDLAGSHPGRSPVRRFGAAVVVADPGLRIGAPGNALQVMRARAHRIVRWRERLEPALRNGVSFTAIRRWLEEEVIEHSRRSDYAAVAIDGYLSVGDAHARITESSAVPALSAGFCR